MEVYKGRVPYQRKPQALNRRVRTLIELHNSRQVKSLQVSCHLARELANSVDLCYSETEVEWV